MKIRRFCSLLAIAFLVNSATSSPPLKAVNCAYAAEEAWKAEFEQICSQTDNATNMSTEELVKSLERCDRLKPQIEQLEATPRKIYLKRLQMCRNLFAYMIETRKKDQKQ
jgi:Skp family chaperone for outer membrane proteins